MINCPAHLPQIVESFAQKIVHKSFYFEYPMNGFGYNLLLARVSENGISWLFVGREF
jgi:hypothetical protein